MERAIIFGCGAGYRRYIDEIKKKYESVAVADNAWNGL